MAKIQHNIMPQDVLKMYSITEIIYKKIIYNVTFAGVI